MFKISLSISKKCIIPDNLSIRERMQYKNGKHEIQRQLDIKVKDINNISSFYEVFKQNLTTDNSSFKDIFDKSDFDEKWKSIVCEGSTLENLVSRKKVENDTNYIFCVDFLSKEETKIEAKK